MRKGAVQKTETSPQNIEMRTKKCKGEGEYMEKDCNIKLEVKPEMNVQPSSNTLDMTHNQETKAVTTSNNDNSNTFGSHHNTAPSPIHGETSEAAKAWDNQDETTNKSNTKLPRILINANAPRLYVTIPKTMTDTAFCC